MAHSSSHTVLVIILLIKGETDLINSPSLNLFILLKVGLMETSAFFYYILSIASITFKERLRIYEGEEDCFDRVHPPF